MRALNYVADTMAVVLDREARRMPQSVKAIFQAAGNGEVSIGMSAMTLAEIGYLFEKRRIGLSIDALLATAEQKGLVILPVETAIIQAAFGISDIPELHDRLIAATARHYGVPLLTNDPVIRASTAGPTIWE